jgi:hypothetical protein
MGDSDSRAVMHGPLVINLGLRVLVAAPVAFTTGSDCGRSHDVGLVGSMLSSM